MKAVVLADFGSTYTKVTVVESGSGRLLANEQSFTTIQTDVMDGYEQALQSALASIHGPVKIVGKLAASSAGGGLRVAAIGLVEDYTAAAARQCALNAGAKIELVLSGQPDHKSVDTLQSSRPDIILFSGGTDGGQRKQVMENAEVIATANVESHVIVACNHDIAPQVARLFRDKFGNAQIVANILPNIRTLDIEPARKAIHEAFISHVIRGKGLSKSNEFDRAVVMPTPESVLMATDLLAHGGHHQPGVGDVLVVDVGGATTDVHSSVSTRPMPAGVNTTGLPTLPLTRSVQGDLGMRWSACGVLDADREWLEEDSRGRRTAGAELISACRDRHLDPAYLPRNEDEKRLDRALAVSCITHALRRHCGSLETIYIPKQGTEFIQRGLDLTHVPIIVGTGGMLVHDAHSRDTLTRALERKLPHSLCPRDPTLILDRNYILSAAGLLATQDKAAASALLRSELSNRSGE